MVGTALAAALTAAWSRALGALGLDAGGDVKRVVFVTQMYPPEKGGNASRIHDTATRLQAGDWEVTVLAPPPTIPPGEFERSWRRVRTETVDGVTVHRLWTPQPLVEAPSMARRLPYYLGFGVHAALWLLRHRRAYDVVVTSTPPISTGAPGLVASALGAPWLVDVRDLWIDAAISLGYIDGDGALARVSRAFQRTVLRRADRVAVTTETTGRRLREAYGDAVGDRTLVLPNGVDTDRFTPVAPAADGHGSAPPADRHDDDPADGGGTEPATEPRDGDPTRDGLAVETDGAGPPTIVYAGNLGTAQDLESCVRALAHVTHDDAVLQLVGGGETESGLRRLAARVGVADRVEFVGPVPRAAVPRYLAAATVGVAPLKDTESLSYAMPTKVYEYMACALPTVVTGRGEIARFAERSGCVHAANDPERIAARLDELLDDPDRRERLGTKGRTLVRERYDRAGIADRLDDELTTLLSSRRN